MYKVRVVGFGYLAASLKYFLLFLNNSLLLRTSTLKFHTTSSTFSLTHFSSVLPNLSSTFSLFIHPQLFKHIRLRHLPRIRFSTFQHQFPRQNTLSPAAGIHNMNVNKKLGRFKQWAGERMGGEVKTSVSDDFKSLEVEMGLRQEGSTERPLLCEPSLG